MATRKKTIEMPEETRLIGDIDTTYLINQRSMFTGGLAAQIGTDAYGVWSAIKAHADFQTGECWPGIRRLAEMTGLTNPTVLKAIQKLEDAHMLRVKRDSTKSNIYVARERMDVHIGKRVICTIVIDYVPLTIRERMAKLKEAAATGDLIDQEDWAEVEVIPGPGMVYDEASGLFKTRMKRSEVDSAVLTTSEMREKLRGQINSMRTQLPKK